MAFHSPKAGRFTGRNATVQLALPDPVALDGKTRTISGDIVPYGVVAPRTSFGAPVMFAAGSLQTPADASRVKLLLDHDMQRPVGYALAIDHDTDRARATFRVADGADGDFAIDQVRQKLRDGMSIGCDILAGYIDPDDGETYVVTAAQLNEVTLCSIPAFADARATDLAANHPSPDADGAGTTTPEGSTMPRPNQPGAAAPAAAPAATEPAATTAAATVAVTAAAAPSDPAPAGVTDFARPATTSGRLVPARAIFDAIGGALATGGTVADIQAALSDIVPASDVGKGLLPEAHVGELWQARGTAVPYVDFAYTRKELTSGHKMIGWAWNARPQVDTYAGNKAEVPSNAATTKAVEASVSRMAGGWDIDRIFVDLADGAMLEEIVRMAIEDYADKINRNARAALIDAATTVDTAGLDLSGVLNAVGTSAVGVGARVDYLALASDVWSSFANLTSLEVPWWLKQGDGVSIGQQNGAVGGVNLWVDPELTAGQWVAGDKRAATWWDKRPPVRVSAVNLPQGGVDVGVFGYFARVVQEGRAVFTGTVAAGE